MKHFITMMTWAICCCLYQPAAAQQQTIKGSVVSASTGETLIGVSVSDGHKALGVTGADGHFSVTAASGAPLTFSFVGFNPVTLPAKNGMRVGLDASTSNLGELVVLGYNTKAARSVTGSATVVSETKLKDVTAASVDKMLQGKVAGVFIGNSSGDPNAAPSIRIRGVGTLTGGSDPLIVVDGVIGDYPNPSDVESVTVLKDAAATTLYGARAANGVLVITTKRGKSGSAKVVARIAEGANSLSQGHFHLMNGPEYYALQKAYYQSTYTGNDFDSYLETVLPGDALKHNTNWLKEAYGTGNTTDAQLSVSGGADKGHYYLSGNYYSEDGILKQTGLKRGAVRLNSDYQVSKKIVVTFNTALRYSKSADNSNGSGYQSYLNLPWDAAYGADGKPVDPRTVNWYGRDVTNFVYDQQYNRYGYKTFDGDILLKGEYTISDHWSLSSTNRVTGDYLRSQTIYDARTAAGADVNGQLEDYSEFQYSYLTSNLLKYRTRLGSNQDLDLLLGEEYQDNYFESTDASGTGIAQGISILDATSAALGVGGTKNSSAFISYFFQANWNLDQRYFLTGSFRRDGSSRFGSAHPYGNFYAIGGAWLLSEEAFLKHSHTISKLKLRASFGTTGNADFSDSHAPSPDPNANYKAYGKYNVTGSYDGVPGLYPSVVDNPDLTWEKAYTANVGFDLGLVHDRVNITVDVYNKENKDLLFNVPLPGTAGFASVARNVGDVNNKGVELGISSVNIQTRDFQWTTDFNISYNKNKITSLYNGVTEINDPQGRFRFITGSDIRTFYMREWMGVDPATGDPLWAITNQDGTKGTTNSYNNATQMPVGSGTPKFTGGFRTTFNYKNFDLGAFLVFVQGNGVYNGNRELFDNDGAYDRYNIMELYKGWSRWEHAGDHATHPKYVVGGNKNSQKTSSRFLEDGSYLRLRNVSLGYNFPSTVLQRLKVENIRLSLSGENLWTLTHFSGIDPDADSRGDIGTKYPFARKLLVGLQINF